MATPTWKLVQSFIREATEDDECNPVASLDIAYKKLRAIQRGHFAAATATDDGGLVQISSTIGGTSFSFAIPASLDRAEIIAVAETALQIIGKHATVASLRRCVLRRRKNTRPDFSTFRL
ncbi:hypothetical protein OpiT1DRAFT_00192 [Opitutaceae bacterium TAV1]|nr:hypothetical protein OpiT1DRAFT_00192 [Opitutaceae bacterium TAV1]